jgi:hypothetical protein
VRWPCQEEAKANVHRPWPFAPDTADRPLRPGRLPNTSERNYLGKGWRAEGAWGAYACGGVRRLAEEGFPAGRRKLHAGTRVLPRDPLALPPFRKFISAFALTPRILRSFALHGVSRAQFLKGFRLLEARSRFPQTGMLSHCRKIWRLRGLFPRFQYVAGGGVCAGGFEARAAEDNDAPAFCPDGSSPKKRRQT